MSFTASYSLFFITFHCFPLLILPYPWYVPQGSYSAGGEHCPMHEASFIIGGWLMNFFPKSRESTENQLSSVSLEKNLKICWCTFIVFTLGIHVCGGSATSGCEWQRLCIWGSPCVRCTRKHVHLAVSCLLWIMTTVLENLKHFRLFKHEWETWLDPWCYFQSGGILLLIILHLNFPLEMSSALLLSACDCWLCHTLFWLCRTENYYLPFFCFFSWIYEK